MVAPLPSCFPRMQGFPCQQAGFLWAVRGHSQGGTHILTRDPC